MWTAVVGSVTAGRGTGLREREDFKSSQVLLSLSNGATTTTKTRVFLPPLFFFTLFLHQETIEVESEHVFKLAALALQVSCASFKSDSGSDSLSLWRPCEQRRRGDSCQRDGLWLLPLCLRPRHLLYPHHYHDHYHDHYRCVVCFAVFVFC